ncbi:hypothetical protein EON62_01485, partial [archaeon]
GDVSAAAPGMHAFDFLCKVPQVRNFEQGRPVSMTFAPLPASEFLNTAVALAVALPVVVRSVQPALLPTEGGVPIVVRAQHVVNTDALMCRFSDAVLVDDAELADFVPAKYVSETELVCVSPVRQAGDAVLEVSTNGVDFSRFGYYVHFSADPIVVAVSPSHGLAPGGTQVRVTGTGFMNVSTLVCRFGGTSIVPAHFEAATSVVCTTPALELMRPASGGLVVVSVSNNNASFSDNVVWFEYIAPPVISALSPSYALTWGGTPILMLGLSHPLLGNANAGRLSLSCRFGLNASGVVPALALTDSRLLCTAPAHALGVTRVWLSTNGQDFVPVAAPFTYIAPVYLVSVSPARGPASSGGTLVTLRGAGFALNVSLECVFGVTRSPATVVSATEAACRAPGASRPGRVPVFLALAGDGSSSNDTHVTPAASTTAYFEYVDECNVFSVTPAKVLITGQVALTIRGANFINTTDLRCLFNTRSVRGVFISSSAVVCVMPSQIGHTAEPYAPVRVSVSLNAQDFSTSSALLTVVSRCPPGSYCPGLTVLPCPNGTFCSGFDNANYTLCEPGSFQPRAGQTRCLPCPVGYYCPDFGLVAPRICTAGSVCSVHKLRMPLLPCPAGHWCPPGTKTTDPLDFSNVHRSLSITRQLRGAGTGAQNSSLNVSASTQLLSAVDEWTFRPDTGELLYAPFDWRWDVSTRTYPASGRFALETAPAGWQRAASALNATLSTSGLFSSILAERPLPCPAGTYCRTGVAINVTMLRNFSTPQPCTRGFYCPPGSVTPQGAGACPTGFFCPNARDAVVCPRGHYCPKVANVRPQACAPGTYNPLLA